MYEKMLSDALIFGVGSFSALIGFFAYQQFSRLTYSVLFDRLRNRVGKWKEKENQPIPYTPSNWNCYDPTNMQPSSAYNLLISAVIPRPIALISSQDSQGVLNCAPYSYFNCISHDPPLIVVGICINGRSKTKKDTLKNIEETGQFVVNIMSLWYLDSANHCCANYPPSVNEMEFAGLTTLPSVVVKPPRVGEAAVQLECEVYELKPINNNAGQHTVTMVMGRILRFHINDQVLSTSSSEVKPEIDWRKLMPIGRMGGNTYAIINDSHDLPRPDRTYNGLYWHHSSSMTNIGLDGFRNDQRFHASKLAIHHSKLYDLFLGYRICLQKSLDIANKLPIENELISLSLYREPVTQLLDDQLNDLYGLLAKDRPNKRKKTSTDGETENENSWWEKISATQDQLQQNNWERTIDQWHARLHFGSEKVKSSMKVFNQTVWDQTNDLLRDETRAIEKSRMPLNDSERIDLIKVQNQNYDLEIFDDRNFYSVLLKTFITTHSNIQSQSTNGLSYMRSEDLETLKTYKKKKIHKNVERKASKGRMIRYLTHQKLEHFMFPIPLIAPSGLDVNKLHQSLFQ